MKKKKGKKEAVTDLARVPQRHNRNKTKKRQRLALHASLNAMTEKREGKKKRQRLTSHASLNAITAPESRPISRSVRRHTYSIYRSHIGTYRSITDQYADTHIVAAEKTYRGNASTSVGAGRPSVIDRYVPICDRYMQLSKHIEETQVLVSSRQNSMCLHTDVDVY
jgi:hypothetical protein